jgi:hypothetical protein
VNFFRLTFLAILLAGTVFPAAGRTLSPKNAGKRLKPVNFHPKPDNPNLYEAVVGRFRLILHEPDAPVEPTSWESPLTVVNLATGKSYDTDVSAIEQVWTADRGRLLVVVAGGDGARASVSFFELATGRERYPKLTALSDGTSVTPTGIIFDAAIEKPDASGVRLCHSARAYRFDGFRPPVFLEEASDQLTKAQVGVVFRGARRVAFAKSEHAVLVD